MSEQKKWDINLIVRIFSYIKPHRSTYYISLALTLALAAIAPLVPWLVQHTIDLTVQVGDANKLNLMLFALLGTLLLQSTALYSQTFYTGLLGQLVIKDLRNKVYTHILHLKISYFDKTPIGTLITRVVSDIESIAEVFSEGFIIIFGDMLKVVVILIVMLVVSWKLTLATLSVLPVLLIAAYIFQIKTKKAFTKVRNEVSALNTFLQEHITGMKVVQLFGREHTEMEKFVGINKKLRDENVRSVLYYAVFFPVVELVSAAALGIIVYYGGKNVLQGEYSIGLITSFILYTNQLFRPIRELADKVNTLQMGMVSSERVFKVLDTNETTPKGGDITQAITGKVEFKKVQFAYKPNELILKGIDVNVPKGKTLAIVGATGAGKSTIISLLNRLYDIESGEILIDGIPHNQYDTTYLRSQIATVQQDVFLFNDTILNNITLYRNDITEQQAVEAAKAIGIHDFIMQLPDNYQYIVKERGTTLSSGQAQLISFTRAFVSNPAVLVLDEATAAIDTESELLVQKAINTLMEGRTAIIIAHRLSTIEHADSILVLDKGEVIEQGSHQELLAQKGQYHKLYQLQYARDLVA